MPCDFCLGLVNKSCDFSEIRFRIQLGEAWDRCLGRNAQRFQSARDLLCEGDCLMVTDNQMIRWVLVILLILLLIPLLVMLGMMMFGGGMMGQMSGGMMSFSTAGGTAMALCALWAVLVAAALVFLIVLLVRGKETPSAN